MKLFTSKPITNFSPSYPALPCPALPSPLCILHWIVYAGASLVSFSHYWIDIGYAYYNAEKNDIWACVPCICMHLFTCRILILLSSEDLLFIYFILSTTLRSGWKEVTKLNTTPISGWVEIWIQFSLGGYLIWSDLQTYSPHCLLLLFYAQWKLKAEIIQQNQHFCCISSSRKNLLHILLFYILKSAIQQPFLWICWICLDVSLQNQNK